MARIYLQTIRWPQLLNGVLRVPSTGPFKYEKRVGRIEDRDNDQYRNLQVYNDDKQGAWRRRSLAGISKELSTQSRVKYKFVTRAHTHNKGLSN